MFSELNHDVSTVGIVRDQNNSCLVLYSKAFVFPEYSLHLARLGSTGEIVLRYCRRARTHKSIRWSVAVFRFSRRRVYCMGGESRKLVNYKSPKRFTKRRLFVWGNNGITLVDSAMGIANIESKSDNRQFDLDLEHVNSQRDTT